MKYEDLCRKLKMREPFSFSRFGDGEFCALLGDSGRNCDNHEYFSSLGAALRQVLIDNPPYYLGLQPKAIRDRGHEIAEWLKCHGIDYHRFINADILHDASMSERLSGFFSALKDREILVVGPVWLRLLPGHLMEFNHIAITTRNAWLDYDEIKAHVEEWLKDHLTKMPVVLYCCGMMTKVLIHELYPKFPIVTQIDAGSVLDYHCGIDSRRYMSEMRRQDKR